MGPVPFNMQPEPSLPRVSNSKSVAWENLAARAQYQPAKIAELCSVSLRTVQRHFRKRYNVTVKEWVRSVQMHEAKCRILAGDPIKAVASDLGFKQVSHFSRVFKQSFGIAPSFLLAREAGYPTAFDTVNINALMGDDPTKKKADAQRKSQQPHEVAYQKRKAATKKKK